MGCVPSPLCEGFPPKTCPTESKDLVGSFSLPTLGFLRAFWLAEWFWFFLYCSGSLFITGLLCCSGSLFGIGLLLGDDSLFHQWFTASFNDSLYAVGLLCAVGTLERTGLINYS
jgi:hypothetical protein